MIFSHHQNETNSDVMMRFEKVFEINANYNAKERTRTLQLEGPLDAIL